MSSLLQRIGGEPGCGALAEAFYRGVEGEPALRALYPRHLRCPRNGLTAFLYRTLGGQTDWPLRPIVPFHTRFRIDRALRDTWLRCMEAALAEVVADEAARAELRRFFSEVATQLVNAGETEASRYGTDPASGELESAWAKTLAMEAALAKLGERDLRAFEALLPHCGPLTSEFVLRVAEAGSVDALDVLVRRGVSFADLQVSPSLLVEHPTVAQRMLDRGATLSGVPGRMPSLIMACRGDKGGRPEPVRLLIEHGASVHERAGNGRTALHYAARAGFIEIAQLLVDAGAEVDAVDSAGLTPLRHADQVGKSEMARWLRRRGATD